jgi:hypothetical protein
MISTGEESLARDEPVVLGSFPPLDIIYRWYSSANAEIIALLGSVFSAVHDHFLSALDGSFYYRS